MNAAHKTYVLLLAGLVYGFAAAECPGSSAGAVKVGTTFSQVQCEYLEMDWKDTYAKTLEMGFDIIRLGAYWSRIEKRDGVFDFSELDWQMQLARKRHQKVLLTVGMKSPRWPEYFIPQWLEKNAYLKNGADVSENPMIKKHVLEFIERTVTRYKDNSAVTAWQVENEPLNRAGPHEWRIAEGFLKEEIRTVEKIDNFKRPIITNVLVYPNKVLNFLARISYKNDPVIHTIDLAEIPAFNVYPIIGHKIGNAGICFRTEPKERIDYLRRLVSYAGNEKKEVWVTELQAEPWEPGHLVYKGNAPITCWPESFPGTFLELRSCGIDTIFLWGAEYWIFRDKRYGDHSWRNAALGILAGRD